MDAEFVYYYHSKSEIDPKRRGKRMTVCCIGRSGRMLFGLAIQNDSVKKEIQVKTGPKNDPKITHKEVRIMDTFKKEFGRNVSHARAEKCPVEVLEMPTEGRKALFVETAKELVMKYLRPNNHFDWDMHNLRAIDAINKKISQLQRSKKILLAWANLSEEDIERARVLTEH